MLPAHPADQPLPLLLGPGDGQARCVRGRLARREDDPGNSTAQEATGVELGPTAELVELNSAQLRDGLVLGHLSGEQAAQYVPHRPARTSRIRCQWVPAQ